VDEVIFLEVLEGDAVHARHRLERFPVTVGRGYANDVILDDPKVSAAHLRIERAEDGALLLRDTGSTNGTFLVEPWTRLAELKLTPEARVAVGDTVLRFRGRGHAVERTWVGAAPEAHRKRLFERPEVFPVALAAMVLVRVLSEYLANYQKTDWGELSMALVMPLSIALLWSGGWSIASRIGRRQFHFSAHGAIGSLALLGLALLPVVLSVLTFSLSLGSYTRWVHELGALGLLAWSLYWHLRYVTRWDGRRLKRTLVALTVFFGIMSQANTLFGNEQFSPELTFDRTLLPPALRVAPARTVDAFFVHTEDLQKEVDALAKEE
jgi:hypothetical protein